jgi:hypothetical protein
MTFEVFASFTLDTVRREFSLAKTAEGACATPIGGLNAQAKGLATALAGACR